MAVVFRVQMFHIVAITVVIFALCAGYASPADQITACDPNRVAACVGDLRKMSSNPMNDIQVAEDVAGLEQKCREMEEAKSCLLRETSFCSEDIRSIYLSYLRPVTASFQDLCTAGKTRDEYLKHAPCFSRMSRRDGPCSAKYVRLSKLMTSDMDFQHNNSLPQFCCVFYAFYNCYRSETEKQCGSEAFKLFERYTGYLSGTLFSGSCEKHLNHTHCDPVASSTTGAATPVACPPASALSVLLVALLAARLRQGSS